MNKYLLLAALFVVAIAVKAQQDKYLAGGVPEVDGKVVFSKTIDVKQQVDDDRLFTLVDSWAKANYPGTEDVNNRVLLSDSQGHIIACAGLKYLVFKKSPFVLDQSEMNYQLILEVKNGNCDVTVRNIRYNYSDSKGPLPAEEMITDKVAINKNGIKLNRYYDKFRRQTIDSVSSIFRSVDIYLNGTPAIVPAAAATQQTPAPVVAKETSLVPAGFKEMPADKIPASMRGKNVLIVSKDGDKTVAVPAKWMGTSTLMDKLQAITNVNADRYSLIENAKEYTIYFFTEMYDDNLAKLDASGNPEGSGLALADAWMMIECKKTGELPTEDINGVSCLGEIINVWAK